MNSTIDAKFRMERCNHNRILFYKNWAIGKAGKDAYATTAANHLRSANKRSMKRFVQAFYVDIGFEAIYLTPIGISLNVYVNHTE